MSGWSGKWIKGDEKEEIVCLKRNWERKAVEEVKREKGGKPEWTAFRKVF
jgi:hypothetical protein